MAMNQIWMLDNPVFFTPPPVCGRYGRLFKGGGAPAAPDPIATAQAQGQANIDAARVGSTMGRTDEISPFGSTKWSQDPNNQDKWTSEFKLDPNIQGMLDNYYAQAAKPAPSVDTSALSPGATGGIAGSAGSAAQAATDRLSQTLSTGFNYDKAPAMPQANEAARKAIEEAYYQKATSRLDPQYQQFENEMRSRLANQGLTEGSEAYNNELQQFMRGRNDAYSGVTNDSILNSTNEMTKLFGMELAARQQGVSEANYLRDQPMKEASAAAGLWGNTSNIANANRTQQLNEQLKLHDVDMSDRNNLLNQLMSLRSGSQVNAPGTGQVQVAAAPVAQSIYNSYQGQLQEAATAQSGQNAMWGAAGSLGGAAIAAF